MPETTLARSLRGSAPDIVGVLPASEVLDGDRCRVKLACRARWFPGAAKLVTER